MLYNVLALPVLVALLASSVTCQSTSNDTNFVPDLILRVSKQNISQACIDKADVALINGTSPGPRINLKEGATTTIRVYNDVLDQNVTMHWHGINVSPYMDGSTVSQWPIIPGDYFDYEVTPPDGSAGSYFYHSHAKGMHAVSANGPLVVEESVGSPPYAYDEDRVIFLTDQYNRTDADIEKGLVSNPFKWSGEVSNVLVNGQSAISNTTQASPTCSLAEIQLEPGKTYRFRFISACSLSFLSLGVQGHENMTIIEADGSYTQGLSISNLQIGGGQRYSTLFYAKTAEELAADRANGTTKYYIQMKTLDRPAVHTSFAVITYSAPTGTELNPAVPPLTLPNTTLTDYNLAPLSYNNFPPASSVTRRVIITVQQIVNGTVIWAQNGYPWSEDLFHPAAPYLLSLYTNDTSNLPPPPSSLPASGIDPNTRTFPASIGEVLEIVLQNTGSQPAGGLDSHPFHAHGAHYYDLGSGNGSYNATANEARLAADGIQPVLRDTTMVYRYGLNTTATTPSGWRAWRLRVQSPGVWPIHCHSLQHMIMGMYIFRFHCVSHAQR